MRACVRACVRTCMFPGLVDISVNGAVCVCVDILGAMARAKGMPASQNLLFPVYDCVGMN